MSIDNKINIDKKNGDDISSLMNLNIELNEKQKLIEEKRKEKEEKLKNNEVLNHNLFKLSDFDMEIIKQIPQGGHWINLCDETIAKSKRLTKIKENGGGRTTFYGRMSWHKPSYTLTTYYNRPGSGCHIHPARDRVISSREAARLQSFPDDYYFYGNQRDICMQIGNAVPPLFSYQLAQNIKEKIDIKNSIDLFCGAGGFYIGFKKNGVNSCLCNDINIKPCISLKINYPNLNVLCGDITKEDVQKEIIRTGKEKNVDIICGGPPCQGFSIVGKRDENDTRNDLFLYYAKVVEAIKPKVIVFENVLGILSYKNGETYESIIKTFKNIGYRISMKKISMEEYGVPQRRKRVIVIGVREDLNIEPEILFPNPITSSPTKQTTVEEAIIDLVDIDFKNPIKTYLIEREKIYISPYALLLQENINFKQFMNYSCLR